MRTDELDYDLPRELIATEPPAERDGARLLHLARTSPRPSHRHVRDLPSLLPHGALLVVNDTRVIPARLRGQKPTGGAVELFLLRPLDAQARRWQCMGRANKPIRPGLQVTLAQDFTASVDARDERGRLEVTLHCDDPWQSIEAHGEVPLPPYMARAPRPEDRERYQTVFAAHPGAVAAPTAGLHLSPSLLERLEERAIERVSVNLHVGAGTFAPIETDDLDTHPMHTERYRIPEATLEKLYTARRSGRPVVAVGTTVVRTLETHGLSGSAPLEGDTALLIQPGYTFRVVDQLLTNFHLPRSTLLALIMAFAGIDRIREAYAEAVRERYRFFSYGDAMLLQ